MDEKIAELLGLVQKAISAVHGRKEDSPIITASVISPVGSLSVYVRYSSTYLTSFYISNDPKIKDLALMRYQECKCYLKDLIDGKHKCSNQYRDDMNARRLIKGVSKDE